MQQPKDPRKTILIFSAAALIFMMVMNLFVMPMITQPTTVTYNEFLTMVEEGKVSRVALDGTGTAIEFLATDDKGRKMVCTTGAMKRSRPGADAAAGQDRRRRAGGFL